MVVVPAVAGTSDTLTAVVVPHESSAPVVPAVYPPAVTFIVIGVVWFWVDNSPVTEAMPVPPVVIVSVPAVTVAPCIALPVVESVTVTLIAAVVHAVVGHELPWNALNRKAAIWSLVTYSEGQ